METTKYNGWTNYATWRVNLEIIDGMDWTGEINEGISYDSIFDLSEYIEEIATEEVEAYSPTKDGLMYHYAIAFLSDVNWYEIAQHIAEAYPNIINSPEESKAN